MWGESAEVLQLLSLPGSPRMGESVPWLRRQCLTTGDEGTSQSLGPRLTDKGGSPSEAE